MEEGKEVQVASGAMDVNKIMALAIEKGDIGQLEKMMELQERYEKNEAKKAYHVAMAAFKANPPKIDKDSKVKYGQTEYKHATLGNVADKINKGLSEHGLSAAWQTEQKEKAIAVTCKITHILGHSESTTLEAGADSSGAKNSIQAIGSTVTYLQRYTLLSLAGLATEEIDDDGQGSGAEYITEDQLETINKGLVKKDVDLGMFLTYMKVETLDKILAKDMKKAEYAISNAKGKK